MTTEEVISRFKTGKALSLEEGRVIYKDWALTDLIFVANEIRQIIHPGNIVTWQIDRNVNISNICFVQCKFCNFCRKANSKDAYTTTIVEYRQKINELFALGGNQLLLQGGMNPALNLDYYITLFKTLKQEFPFLKLHALGPPEIFFLAKKERKRISEILEILVKNGLDSLPGAGAEILSNRVRNKLSNGKCSVEEWIEVMRKAHKMGLYTSATMMFGHVETLEERLQHLIYIRELQNEKPIYAPGFTAFIPWPVQLEGTILFSENQLKSTYATEYLKMVAISRIMLLNIPNIQASWLTVGKSIGSLALHAGANDLGSIMIEENVVSAAGVRNTLTSSEMKQLIIKSGFVPRQRNQRYELID